MACKASHSSLMAAPRLSLLAVDFDETLTTHDTTEAVLFESVLSEVIDPAQRCRRRKIWDSLVNRYTAESKMWMKDILGRYRSEPLGSGSGGSSTVEHRHAIRNFAAELSAFEKKCVGRVAKSQVLAGVSRRTLRLHSERLGKGLMRRGAKEAIREARSVLGARVAVISINWSEDVVRGVLHAAGCSRIIDEVRCNDLDFRRRQRNMLESSLTEPEVDEVSTGSIHKVIGSASGKLLAQREALLVAEAHSPCGGYSVFIGDSATDLPSMVEADIGIVVGVVSDSFYSVSEAFGITLKPIIQLHRGDMLLKTDKNRALVIYSASCWVEIQLALRAVFPSVASKPGLSS